MGWVGRFRGLTASQRNAFVACFLGWSLDAFDYFILVFCVSAIARDFHAQVTQVAEALFLTLAMRPVGAFLFGRMADKYGRRPTLMVNIVCYSIFELASAFAPSLKMLLVCRALFGIAMGGEWGVGAALAFETLPAEGRGFFSGLLQEGYVVGNLVAGLVYALVFPLVGWRGMFVIGALPAFLVLYIRSKVEESPAWLETRRLEKASAGLPALARPSLAANLKSYAPTFIFLVVLMTAFTAFSHGTQDLYPTFLEKNHAFGPRATGLITSVGNVGALLGGICFGAWSERLGRRKAIVLASLLAIPMIPIWAWSHSAALLAVGAFLMQFMVQGAWGVVPAHLNELSPAAVRGTFPGLAYQLGNLLSSRNAVLQAKMAAGRFGGNFRVVLSVTVFVVALLVAGIAFVGKEAKGGADGGMMLKCILRTFVGILLCGCAGMAQTRRLVLIDQDGSGPGGSNQMAMMVLLQSPQAEVLGITMVSGNAWEPEEVRHTLRMLELIQRTDVPVVPGAVFPLVRTEQEALLERKLYGTLPWYGAWGDLAAHTSMQPYHGPFVLPKLEEGEPSLKASTEDAAHFLIRQVRAHPHLVTIYAAGPLTNIALALAIDPEFAGLTQGIVIMGGSLAPRTDDPEFANNPRHEFNFWFDPEAAHIVLRAHWPRIDLTTVDISIKTQFTKAMLEEIEQSSSPAAKYLGQYTREFYYLWDELAAAAWLDPAMITKEEKLYVDVDLTRGPGYGDTLSWTEASKPALDVQLVHVWVDVDLARFNAMFVGLMKR